ncbi:MAG: hypothetical protein EXR77_08715 [Myxococcales bacterium]|nr:hypothetical protein [Myxococcales bacterium]
MLTLAGLATTMWGMAQIEAQVRAAVDARLANSGFSVAWGRMVGHLDGTIEVDDVAIREGNSTLLTVRSARAQLSLWTLLRGTKRLNWLAITEPIVWADVFEGKLVAWQRLAQAVKKTPQSNEDVERKSLADRVGKVTIRQGVLKIKVLGKQVWLLGTDLHVHDANVDLDTATGGIASFNLPRTFGGGAALVTLGMTAGQPSTVELKCEPAARYLPPDLASEWLPKELALQVAGASWTPNQSPVLHDVRIIDLAADASAAQLMAAQTISVLDSTALTLHHLQVHVRKDRWWPQLEKRAAAHPATLPHEWTAVAALADFDGTLLNVHVAKRGGGAVVDVHKAVVGNNGVRLGFNTLRLEVGPKNAQGQREPVTVQLDGPFVELPRKLVPAGRATAVVDGVLGARQVSDPAPEDEDDDQDAVPAKPEPDLPTIVPSLVPSATAKGDARERPPQRMTRQFKALHKKILGIHDHIGRNWPFSKWPGWLHISVANGAAVVLGDDGQPLVGIRTVSAIVDGAKLAADGVGLGMELFDRKGSWGRTGVRWRRLPDGHHLDVQLAGGGVAQVIGSQLSGLSVGDGADLDVQFSVDVKEDQNLRIAGRASVEKMGIQWWRLADRPIADFAASFVFELSVTPTQIVFRTPQLQVGEAQLHGSLALTNMAGSPHFALRLDAPMQDCGRMLASIPPSLVPTIGRIDAHGVLDWHVGLDVAFPQVGAVAVDLSLGDTFCTVDRLGDIDFGEFKRPDWTRPVNENGKILQDVQIGPGSGSWTSTMNMPGYVHYVMWATEDPFLKHRGISESLLEKAIGIDLATGRFTYGGSTITQQLVKNLYLRRTKALSRKFEEMLIVWQMEKALGKARILEIYVNGVEFGPRIYGITRAAWEFFQKQPNELRPKEAVYLAIIKPSPRSGWGTMRANGWGEWYEMKVGKYMDKLLRDESISLEQYEADRPWKPAFNPAPRGVRPGR